jgi:probable HAF family extracellular repeat protein
VIAGRGSRYFGALDHADGTQTPGVWTANVLGGWTVQDLGHRTGFDYGEALGARSDGAVLASYSNSAATSAASYLVNGSTVTPLTGPDGEVDVWTGAIASDGTVVGSVSRDGAVWSGALWTLDASTGRYLRSLTQSKNVVPIFIDDEDDVIGYEAPAVTATVATAVIWPHGGNGLPGPPLGPITEPEAVNAAGRLVGWFRTSSGQARAFVADPEHAPIDLGTLPGDDFAVLYGLNDDGQAVGVSGNSGSDARAVYWNGQGALAALPGLPGATSSVAYGLDGTGRAWGESAADGITQPTLWTCANRAQPATAQPQTQNGAPHSQRGKYETPLTLAPALAGPRPAARGTWPIAASKTEGGRLSPHRGRSSARRG